jgi:hypothetical protein
MSTVHPARIIFALAAMCSVALPAQGQSNGSRAVRIAVAQRISPTDTLAGALVLQTASPGQPDVIVVKEGHLTPQMLGGALGLLRTLNSKGRPAKDRFVYVKGSVPGRDQGLSKATSQKLEAIIRQLAAAPKAQIGNLGEGRWIERPSASIR